MEAIASLIPRFVLFVAGIIENGSAKMTESITPRIKMPLQTKLIPIFVTFYQEKPTGVKPNMVKRELGRELEDHAVLLLRLLIDFLFNYR